MDDPYAFGQPQEDESDADPAPDSSPDTSTLGGLPPLQDPYVQAPETYARFHGPGQMGPGNVGLGNVGLGNVGHGQLGQPHLGQVHAPRSRFAFVLPIVVVIGGLSVAALAISQVGAMAGLWGADQDTSRRASRDVDDDRHDADDKKEKQREAELSRDQLAKPTPPPPPQASRTEEIGDITVVDIGVDTDSLEEALAEQSKLARDEGERVLVMTIQADCEPCQGVANSLEDPLMQDALDGIRLVRVNITDFWRELSALNMFHDVYPGYFLLSPDLTPFDAINGGEWGEDIAENIAPVLGPFVRGEYDRRKSYFRNPRRGVRL